MTVDMVPGACVNYTFDDRELAARNAPGWGPLCDELLARDRLPPLVSWTLSVDRVASRRATFALLRLARWAEFTARLRGSESPVEAMARFGIANPLWCYAYDATSVDRPLEVRFRFFEDVTTEPVRLVVAFVERALRMDPDRLDVASQRCGIVWTQRNSFETPERDRGLLICRGEGFVSRKGASQDTPELAWLEVNGKRLLPDDVLVVDQPLSVWRRESTTPVRREWVDATRLGDAESTYAASPWEFSDDTNVSMAQLAKAVEEAAVSLERFGRSGGEPRRRTRTPAPEPEPDQVVRRTEGLRVRAIVLEDD